MRSCPLRFATITALLSAVFASGASAQRLTCLMGTVDHHVIEPCPSVTISAVVEYASGWTIDAMTIWVDGSTLSGLTIDQQNMSGSASWNASTATDASEHVAWAYAKISHAGYYPGAPRIVKEYYSYNDPTDPNPGDGRKVDFIISAIRPWTVDYTNGISLNWDRYTYVEEPVIQWYDGIFDDPEGQPVAFVRNQSPQFTVDCDPLNADFSTCEWGFTMTFEGTPTYRAQGDPATLVIYDTALVTSTIPITRTSQSALWNYVNVYENEMTFQLYAHFRLSGDAWVPVRNEWFTAHNTMYATLDAPKAPMSPPWADVLDDGCRWAAGAADAVTATRKLTDGEYTHLTYNGGVTAHTNTTDDSTEEFFLLDFMNGTVSPNRPAYQGQCNDFADYLVCLSTAVGSVDLSSQRSCQWAALGNPRIYVNPITKSPSTGAATKTSFAYHQFTASNIYDGCIRFAGPITIFDMTIDAYRQALLDPAYNPNQWNPQTPFKPLIRNTRVAP